MSKIDADHVFAELCFGPNFQAKSHYRAAYLPIPIEYISPPQLLLISLWRTADLEVTMTQGVLILHAQYSRLTLANLWVFPPKMVSRTVTILQSLPLQLLQNHSMGAHRGRLHPHS